MQGRPEEVVIYLIFPGIGNAITTQQEQRFTLSARNDQKERYPKWTGDGCCYQFSTLVSWQVLWKAISYNRCFTAYRGAWARPAACYRYCGGGPEPPSFPAPPDISLHTDTVSGYGRIIETNWWRWELIHPTGCNPAPHHKLFHTNRLLFSQIKLRRPYICFWNLPQHCRFSFTEVQDCPECWNNFLRCCAAGRRPHRLLLIIPAFTAIITTEIIIPSTHTKHRAPGVFLLPVTSEQVVSHKQFFPKTFVKLLRPRVPSTLHCSRTLDPTAMDGRTPTALYCRNSWMASIMISEFHSLGLLRSAGVRSLLYLPYQHSTFYIGKSLRKNLMKQER